MSAAGLPVELLPQSILTLPGRGSRNWRTGFGPAHKGKSVLGIREWLSAYFNNVADPSNPKRSYFAQIEDNADLTMLQSNYFIKPFFLQG